MSDDVWARFREAVEAEEAANVQPEPDEPERSGKGRLTRDDDGRWRSDELTPEARARAQRAVACMMAELSDGEW